MSTAAESRARPVSAAAAGLARLRRGSMAVLVLIVLEYGIGMYVNLYVSVPAADHGRSPGSAIANGPVMLSVHIVIGLLLALGAVGVLAQAVVARRPRAIAATAAGLFAVAVAAVAGAGYTSNGQPAESMAMSVLTGVALLCYAANLYWLPRAERQAGSDPASSRT